MASPGALINERYGLELESEPRLRGRRGLTFASGAVRAALWLRDQGPGLHDMQDVLDLK